jgi:pimeloyl-ACP methyl ester carboxylesterase
MRKGECVFVFAFFVLLFACLPVFPIHAQESCGGIVVKTPSGTTTDPFESCSERDAFANIYNTALSDETVVHWGDEVLGGTLTPGEEDEREISLSFETLPEPASGCGDYGDLCANGLVVDIYYRVDENTFVPYWQGSFNENGKWVEQLPVPVWGGGMYTYEQPKRKKLGFKHDGSYYLFLHRPRPLMVSDASFGSRFLMMLFGIKSVYAFSEREYSDTFVGGVNFSVSHVQNPALTLPKEGVYGGERGVNSQEVNPEKGVANNDVFVFKVVYTDKNGVIPESVFVSVAGKKIKMATDTKASDATLRDGDVKNGEQYFATSTFEKDFYTYEFLASTTSGEVTLSEKDDSTLLTFVTGYSPVAFLPGLQASRLFKKNLLFENQLWEPNRDADVKKLKMNESGKSFYRDIYTKEGEDGVVDEGFDFAENIYKSFLNDLDEWKNDEHVIDDYVILPYDWRLAFGDILSGGKNVDGKLYYDSFYATDTPFILSSLMTLAKASHTGKITIVAHSMGGLVIKKLLADIEDNPEHPYRDLLGRIDTVVLVAVPQLGTPKAIASFLHGAGQELDVPLLGYPNFATAETLREVAHDMPGPYSLFPSPKYFTQVSEINETDEEKRKPTVITREGVNAETYDAMRDYFSTDYGTSTGDLTVPLQPRSDFLDDARELHLRVDDWSVPDMDADGKPDFSVVQVAGWGVADTIKGIKYVKRQRKVDCPQGSDSSTPEALCYEEYVNPEPEFTYDGDGTVVVPSAIALKGAETWFVNILEYNDRNKDRNHASIFEIPSIRGVVHSVFQKQKISGDYLATSTDVFQAPKKYIHLSLHSPVDLRLLNDDGLFISTATTSSTTIPNAYYFTLAESKYLGAPFDKPYTVELSGTGEGVFTLVFTEERDGVEYVSKTFLNIPVSTTTHATFTLQSVKDLNEIRLDTNGDGDPDTFVYPEGEKKVTFASLREEIKKTHTPAKGVLLRTLKRAEFFAERGKTKKSLRALTFLKKEIRILSKKNIPVFLRISKSEKETLLYMINTLQKNLKNNKKI